MMIDQKQLLPLLLLVLGGLFFGGAIQAQPQLIDKVVAQVGDQMILKSDIEFQYLQFQQESSILPPDTRCQILDQMVAQRMLVIQAEKDSVVVGDDEVEQELDRRIQYFVQLMGSTDKLEEYYGKSIVQLKEEFREDIKSQLLAQRMQGMISGNVNISPAEVKDFYKRIPKDSLPYFSAEVELSHLVMIPRANAEQKKLAKDEAVRLRERILAGEKMSTLAVIYSDDPGSAADNGYLGCMGRGELVTEFEAAAFKLKNGEISEVVETEYGYHIIEMVERKGDRACLRHILITPPVTATNRSIVSNRLDSIRAAIVAGTLDWEDAVKKFSEDEATNKSGGAMINPTDGSSIFRIDELEKEAYFSIENLEVGDISQPSPYTDAAGKQGLRLLQLEDETEPHQANLRQDYSKIQAAALNEKQVKLMDEWYEREIGRTYLNIDQVFDGCAQKSTKWNQSANAR